MQRMLMAIAALALSTSALAQSGPPGGGGAPPGGGRGRPPGEGPPGAGFAPRPVKPVKREKFDKAVTALFRSVDTNRDGFVMLEELRAIIDTRRDTAIRARFEKVDSNRNGSVDLNEFLAWQRQMGSLALSEDQPIAAARGPVPETVEPELGEDMDDRILARLIEPLGALTIVNANTNYDSGMTLEELLAYQRKRFDAADKDGDGEISMEEMRTLAQPGAGRGFGTGRAPDRRPHG